MAHRGGNFDHVVDNRIRTLDEVYDMPHGNMAKDRKQLFKNMAQGQKGMLMRLLDANN